MTPLYTKFTFNLLRLHPIIGTSCFRSTLRAFSTQKYELSHLNFTLYDINLTAWSVGRVPFVMESLQWLNFPRNTLVKVFLPEWRQQYAIYQRSYAWVVSSLLWIGRVLQLDHGPFTLGQSHHTAMIGKEIPYINKVKYD